MITDYYKFIIKRQDFYTFHVTYSIYSIKIYYPFYLDKSFGGGQWWRIVVSTTPKSLYIR